MIEISTTPEITSCNWVVHIWSSSVGVVSVTRVGSVISGKKEALFKIEQNSSMASPGVNKSIFISQLYKIRLI